MYLVAFVIVTYMDSEDKLIHERQLILVNALKIVNKVERLVKNVLLSKIALFIKLSVY